jgi:hypothetical protein
VAFSLKRISNHPAASWLGPLETVYDYLAPGNTEQQQTIHFDHPSVGTVGIHVRRQLTCGTIHIRGFTLPDGLFWSCHSFRMNTDGRFDPKDAAEQVWLTFQGERDVDV